MWQTKSKTAGKMLTGKLSVEKVVFQCFVLLLGYFPFLLRGFSSFLVNHHFNELERVMSIPHYTSTTVRQSETFFTSPGDVMCRIWEPRFVCVSMTVIPFVVEQTKLKFPAAVQRKQH